MPTNLAIDDELLEKARRIGKHKTKRETVNTALREYIQRRKQKRVLSLFGKLNWISAYDYKARRRRS